MALPKLEWPLFEIFVPSMQKKARFRQILVKEDKILAIAKQSGEIRDILLAVKQIVNNCIADVIDIDKLPIFDLEWIFIQLFAISFTNVIKASYQDNEDQEIRTFDVDLSKIVMPTIEGVNNNIKINNGYGIIFDFPAAGLYKDDAFMSKEQDVDQLVDYLTTKCIRKVYGPDGEFISDVESEIKEFVDNLDIKSMEAIRQFFAAIPQMTFTIEYQNNLYNQRKIVLSTLNDFFSWL